MKLEEVNMSYKMFENIKRKKSMSWGKSLKDIGPKAVSEK